MAPLADTRVASHDTTPGSGEDTRTFLHERLAFLGKSYALMPSVSIPPATWWAYSSPMTDGGNSSRLAPASWFLPRP